MVLILSPSRSATYSSPFNCSLELSKTVTSPPAADKIGPCCPPPLAKHKTFFPFKSPIHYLGTILVGVR